MQAVRPAELSELKMSTTTVTTPCHQHKFQRRIVNGREERWNGCMVYCWGCKQFVPIITGDVNDPALWYDDAAERIY